MRLENYYIDPQYILKKKPPLNGRHEDSINNLIHWDETRRAWLNEMLVVNGQAIDMVGHMSQGETFYSMHTQLFKLNKGKVYIFNENFLRCLLDSEITGTFIDHLPTQFTGYVAFPRGLVRYKDLSIAGVYLDVGTDERIPIHPEKPFPTIWATFLSDIPGRDLLNKGEFGLVHHYLGLNPSKCDDILREDIAISNITNGATSEYSDKKMSMPLIRTTLLALMYLSSAEPDLRHLRPRSELSKSGAKGLVNAGRAQELEDNYCEDIGCALELVSWGWGKHALYVKDEWEVRGYFKGVPHGPGKSLRKSMFFPPQVRHRNKDLVVGDMKGEE